MVTKPKKVLDSSDYKKINRMAGVGVRIETMAHILGLNPRTFENILRRDKEAKRQYHLGKAAVEKEVTESLYELIQKKDRAIHDDIEAEQEDLKKFLDTTQKEKVTL